MKSRTKLTLSLTVLIVVLGVILIPENDNYEITLSVDTSKITPQSIDEFANFGQPDSIPNKDFTYEVEKGERIKWKGKDLSSDSLTIKIDEIRYESGTQLFRNKNHKRPFWRRSTIRRKVSRGGGGESEKYMIKFSFEKNSQKFEFEIDPKLIIKRKK